MQMRTAETSVWLSNWAMSQEATQAKSYAQLCLTDSMNQLCEGELGIPIRIRWKEDRNIQTDATKVTMVVDLWMP